MYNINKQGTPFLTADSHISMLEGIAEMYRQGYVIDTSNLMNNVIGGIRRVCFCSPLNFNSLLEMEDTKENREYLKSLAEKEDVKLDMRKKWGDLVDDFAKKCADKKVHF